MYRIEYEDPNKIFETAVKIMSESRERYGVSTAFSVILDKESRLEEKDRIFIEGECPDWITFCGMMKLKGYGNVIGEIEWMESKIHSVLLERNLMAAFNDGDKDGIDLCLKAMSGVMGKAKLGLSKGDSDRKNAEALMRIKKEADGLEKYDTKKLEEMLEAVKKEESDNGETVSFDNDGVGRAR